MAWGDVTPGLMLGEVLPKAPSAACSEGGWCHAAVRPLPALPAGGADRVLLRGDAEGAHLGPGGPAERN